MRRLISASLCLVGTALAVAACTRASETDDARLPAAAQPAEVSDEPAAVSSGAPVSDEVACRRAVEIQYGQSGPAITFLNGEISWRAPVDGGRLSFTCAVEGTDVTLTRDGQRQVVTLNTSADAAAQEEAP